MFVLSPKFKLFLASKSPRRAQLLREAGIPFSTVAMDVSEDFPDDVPVAEVPEMLSCRKADAVAHVLTENAIILAADSVVILEGRIFNKPENELQAFEMIRSLSEKKHTVITGVCLRGLRHSVSFSAHTDVWFGPISDEEINFYISQFRPFDKAGAYGVQEWLGHCKIVRMEGTYTNVMGLPVDRVYHALQTFV
jgi:septum formation protein